VTIGASIAYGVTVVVVVVVVSGQS